MTQFVKVQADDPAGPTYWLNLEHIQSVARRDRALTVVLADRSTMSFQLNSPSARRLLDAVENPPSNMDARKAVETLALHGMNAFVTEATENLDNNSEEDDDFWNP